MGAALVTYGVGKISLAAAVESGWFAGLADPTAAGRVLEFVLVAFGMYTVFHGMCLLHMVPEAVARAGTSPRFVVAVYLLFGVGLLGFFSLILFTDAPISRDPKRTATYEVLGLGGGITFLAIATWHLLRASPASWPAAAAALTALLAALCLLVYRRMRNARGGGVAEAIALGAVPLGAL